MENWEQYGGNYYGKRWEGRFDRVIATIFPPGESHADYNADLANDDGEILDESSHRTFERAAEWCELRAKEITAT